MFSAALVPVKEDIAASESWYADERESVDHYVEADLTLIISTLAEALSRVSDQLQFLWHIKKCANAVVIKVKEEGEEEEEEDTSAMDVFSNNVLDRGEEDGSEDEDADDHDFDYEEEEVGVEGTSLTTSSTEFVPAKLSLSQFTGGKAKKTKKTSKKKKANSEPSSRFSDSHSLRDSGKEKKKSNYEPRVPKETREKGFNQVVKVIDALERDLDTNFANEYLKMMFEHAGRKYTAIVIAAVYLLPHGASLRAVKKFAFTYVLKGTKTKGPGNFIVLGMEALVGMNVLTRRAKKNPSSKHYLSADFRRHLLMRYPRGVHDPVKLARFQEKYALKKMGPGKATKWEKKRIAGVLKEQCPPKRETPLSPDALRVLKELTRETEMEEIKQEISLKIEGGEVKIEGGEVKVEPGDDEDVDVDEDVVTLD